MVECDICGDEIEGPMYNRVLEGARITVCKKCSKFGEPERTKQAGGGYGYGSSDEYDISERRRLLSEGRHRTRPTSVSGGSHIGSPGRLSGSRVHTDGTPGPRHKAPPLRAGGYRGRSKYGGVRSTGELEPYEDAHIIIKMEREKRGWSHKELAMHSGVKANFIARLERGETVDLDIIEWRKLERALNVNLVGEKKQEQDSEGFGTEGGKDSGTLGDVAVIRRR